MVVWRRQDWAPRASWMPLLRHQKQIRKVAVAVAPPAFDPEVAGVGEGGDVVFVRVLGVDRFAFLECDFVSADVLDGVRSIPASWRPMVLMTADIRSPKDAIDTELVQIIIRRALKIA